MVMTDCFSLQKHNPKLFILFQDGEVDSVAPVPSVSLGGQQQGQTDQTQTRLRQTIQGRSESGTPTIERLKSFKKLDSYSKL